MGGEGHIMDMNNRIKDNRRLVTEINSRYASPYDFKSRFLSRRKKKKIKALQEKPLSPEQKTILLRRLKKMRRKRTIKNLIAFFLALVISLGLYYLFHVRIFQEAPNYQHMPSRTFHF